MALPADIAIRLRKMADLMDTLSGQPITGVALIVGPDGDPVEFAMLGTPVEAREFYSNLAQRIATIYKLPPR